MRLLLILLSFHWSFQAAQAQYAEHATFTPKQLAEHLGLHGGNWSVSFEERLLCGFIITETTADGVAKKDYFWSSEASKHHRFHFMHHIEKSGTNGDFHEFKFSSHQEADWEEAEDGSAVRTRSSSGMGWGYNTQLPSRGSIETRIRQNSVKLKPETPELLFSWQSNDTKRAFRLEVVFSKG